jgi:pilus assembly protein Flp/PilA
VKIWTVKFHQDHSAVSAMEYALLGALIAVIIVGAVTTVGTQLFLLYETIKDQVVLAMR